MFNYLNYCYCVLKKNQNFKIKILKIKSLFRNLKRKSAKFCFEKFQKISKNYYERFEFENIYSKILFSFNLYFFIYLNNFKQLLNINNYLNK